MGVEKDRKTRFIRGVYNYCDRWCERCPLTHRCLLFHQETQLRAATLSGVAEDDEEDDWGNVLNSLKETFQQTRAMVEEKAEEMGVDLSKETLDRIDAQQRRKRKRIAKHPLRVKSHKWAMDCHRLLEKLSTLIHEQERTGEFTESLAELQESFLVLSWYHMQIAVKIDRALHGLRMKEDMPARVSHDAKGSAKVAFLGISKCLDALTKFYELYQPMHTEIMPLLTVLYEMMEEVDRIFPGHRNFKRPGFDD